MKRLILSTLLLVTCPAAGWAIGFYGTAMVLGWFVKGDVESAILTDYAAMIGGFVGGLMGFFFALYKVIPDGTPPPAD